MNWVLPATVMGAARFALRILALALTGALGGLIYAHWAQPRVR